ncbi:MULTISPECIES: AraC family transcriptional regulator [Falsihalocynthiibacter]|uniref:AraC family transcriptional regulator n=1 Tax=Falsihalocynthiibacter TaxID=2854182 RepID=UPI0030033346
MERIFRSIDFVEKNMFEPIDIHDMAKASHYSTYHFCRIFRSLVGDAPKEYLRKRRLTIAAQRLAKGESSILDIALSCQFESHAAFTRAFKQLFKTTPEQYRENADPFRLIYKDQFSPHMLNHLQNRLVMEPNIVVRSEVRVIGTARQYTEEDLDMDTLWSAFREEVVHISNRVGRDAFGIYEEYQESEDGVGFSYICAVEVSDFDNIPDGMIARVIPSHLYAVFQHEGPVSSLPETMKYIWGSWLPKSDYEYVEKPDFELYSPDAQPKGADKTLFLHIPVSRK